MTVDSDTSTSDTLLLFATGKAAARGQAEITDAKDRRLSSFKRALNALLLDLAVQVARDGEGARKLITVKVEGAVSARSAKKNRHVDCQFAACEDRCGRRGRELGPYRHGRRQGR